MPGSLPVSIQVAVTYRANHCQPSSFHCPTPPHPLCADRCAKQAVGVTAIELIESGRPARSPCDPSPSARPTLRRKSRVPHALHRASIGDGPAGRHGGGDVHLAVSTSTTTCSTAEMIRLPPGEPVTAPARLSTMVGDIDDNGRFQGRADWLRTRPGQRPDAPGAAVKSSSCC
jgi:hypothetical protein